MTEARKPSVYTPLARRFTNQRARELRETQELYAKVAVEHEPIEEALADFVRRFMPIINICPDELKHPMLEAITRVAGDEDHIWLLPPPAVEEMTMEEYVEYRNMLFAKEHFLANRDEILDLLESCITDVVLRILENTPSKLEPSPFSIPLINLLDDPKGVISHLWPALAPGYARGLFKTICDQTDGNLKAVSGVEDIRSSRKLVMPYDSPLPPLEMMRAYLAGTHLYPLFLTRVPLQIPREARFSHTIILGGSGSGKTTLIENLIRHDLASDDPPTIVLVDPHSDLTRKLVRSDLGIEDKLILIDPRDTKHPLALNPFALNRERLDTYDEVTREQVTAGVIETFGYLWGGLTNLNLTGKQEVLFRYVTRLMLTLPDVMGRNATILDMLKLMSDPAPYMDVIQALPEIPRDFFLRDFANKSFEGTREQIRYRLQAIIENPTMARLFTAPETRVDFFTEMNRGAVILIDTAKDFLKEGSAIFGKLLISLILQAVMERAAVPEGKRKPTFIMIDEAATFFSSNIDDLLTEARKHKCGVVLSHQFRDQSSSALQASIAANTGIKFASGLSAQDAYAMSRDMRTTAEFILEQPKLHFALYVRNHMSAAVSVSVEPVRNPRPLSPEAFDELMRRNRERVSLGEPPALPSPDPPPSAPPPSPPGEDISADW